MYNQYVCDYLEVTNTIKVWTGDKVRLEIPTGLCYRSSDWLTPAHKWTEVYRRCAVKFYFIICARWGDRDSKSTKSDGIFSEFKLKLCNLGEGEGVFRWVCRQSSPAALGCIFQGIEEKKLDASSCRKTMDLMRWRRGKSLCRKRRSLLNILST